jgi:RNA polymerase sigma-70 factor (ECF subfamily)
VSDSDPTHQPPNPVNVGGASPGEPELVAPPSAQELERVRRRDPEALGAFFDRYLPFVYGLLFRLTGDRTTAEDLSQDVFLKVHRALDRLDPTRDPKPWLTTVAYNACRDHWRSSTVRRAHESHSLDDEARVEAPQGSSADSALDSLLKSEQEQLVQRAIDALALPLREVVVLHAYQGLSHDQIAELIGVSHAAVRKRYSRAIATLSQSVGGWLE